MAQFAGSDAAISILTDDDDDDDGDSSSSENEIYSRTEPETESASARRPMVGRRDRSRDRSDDRSQASGGGVRPIEKRGTRRDFDVPGSDVTGIDRDVTVQSTETGSRGGGLLGTSLSPTAVLAFGLLVAAFPVHFPSVLLPGSGSGDAALRLTVSLALVGGVAASLTSPLALRMAAGSLRSLLAAAGVGVTAFAVVRCVRAAPAALLASAACLAGFLLADVRAAAAAASCRARPPPTPVPGPPRRDGAVVDPAAYLACALLTLVGSGVAPFVAAALCLGLLATLPSSSHLPSVTSSTPGRYSVAANLTSSASNLTDGIDNVLSPTAGVATPSPTTAVSSYSSRVGALSACLVVCSLGALLLALGAFDDDDPRYRKEKSRAWTVSGVCRLVLGPLGAFRRLEVALLSPLALFVGAQQLFAYFAYIQVGVEFQ